MYFGSNDSTIVTLLSFVGTFYFVEVSAFLVVSLQWWDLCDMASSKIPPKVCVMQRNIGDFLQLEAKILLADGEEVEVSDWYRMVRLFPGDKTLETLLTTGRHTVNH
jgi:hypothetical protein